MADFDIVDTTGPSGVRPYADDDHEHAWIARGVQRVGPVFTLTSNPMETKILWRCDACGAYEVETVPGGWSAVQLGVSDTAVETTKREPVSANFPTIAAGAVGVSKTLAAAAQDQAKAERARWLEEAAHGGAGEAPSPED